MRRKIARVLMWCAVVLPCSGCVWLQNEFFVFDRAPHAEPPAASGTDVPW